jgi:starvation-inducible DNA-binding protein
MMFSSASSRVWQANIAGSSGRLSFPSVFDGTLIGPSCVRQPCRLRPKRFEPPILKALPSDSKRASPTGDKTIEKKRISQISTDLSSDTVVEISGELRKLLADVFALYVKTKNFHWHMSGRHFRDYHLLLDEHGTQIFAMTDDIAERARKIGGTTIRSVSDISKHQRLKDNNADGVAPEDMLAELRADNQELTRNLRSTHGLCEKHNDVATASLIENWIDETERRAWFLSEIVTER